MPGLVFQGTYDSTIVALLPDGVRRSEVASAATQQALKRLGDSLDAPLLLRLLLYENQNRPVPW